jgi:hypothetical protein
MPWPVNPLEKEPSVPITWEGGWALEIGLHVVSLAEISPIMTDSSTKTENN